MGTRDVLCMVIHTEVALCMYVEVFGVMENQYFRPSSLVSGCGGV